MTVSVSVRMLAERDFLSSWCEFMCLFAKLDIPYSVPVCVAMCLCMRVCVSLYICLQNVTSFLAGNTELIVALITRSQCIPALLEVSRCSSAACQESALSALGNLATDEDTCHTALVSDLSDCSE